MRGRREICGREEQVRQLSQSARMWSGVLGKDIISGRSVKAISKGDSVYIQWVGNVCETEYGQVWAGKHFKDKYATALLHMANAKLPKQLRDFVFHGYIRSLYE